MKQFSKFVFLFIFSSVTTFFLSAEGNGSTTDYYNFGNSNTKIIESSANIPSGEYSTMLFESVPSNRLNNVTETGLLKNDNLYQPSRVSALFSVNFTFLNNQCSSSQVTFTPTPSGSAYTYLWNFGDGTTSTQASPSHIFTASGNGTKTFSIKLTVTEIATSSQNSITKTLTVTQSPDPTLTSNAELIDFNGEKTFKTCSNSTTDLTFYNTSSTSATNINYLINWGDGTPSFSGSSWVSLVHKYPPGNWTMNYTITGQNGCSITKTYKVFVGTNPTVSMGYPSSTNICVATPLTFPISGTSSNPPGTIYTITFNDGSAPEVLTSAPVSVTHTFLTTSCGTTSFNGSTNFQNAFSASIVASNPCGNSSTVYIAPIYVSTPPTNVNFSISKKVACIGEQIIIKDSTFEGFEAGPTGCSTPKIIWNITPLTNVTLNVGSYGNDFGSSNVATWETGTDSIVPTFLDPGKYLITMKLGNKCGIEMDSDTICVEDRPKPLFTLDNLQGCAPLTVNATNNTDLSSSCSPISYSWDVIYTPTNCGTASGYSYINSTGPTSENPSFQFVNSGTYTIRLTAVNQCGSQSTEQNVVVKMPPQASVSIPPVCQTFPTTTVFPTCNVTNCGSSNLTYAWRFPGGVPTTSTDSLPGGIEYPSDGTYTVTLVVTNECDSTVTSKSFTINKSPEVDAVPDQVKCADQLSDIVNFTGTLPGTTYNWTNNNPVIGLGASGTGTINPFVVKNPGLTVQTAVITVTPLLNGCTGPSKSFTITVNPSPTASISGSTSLCVNGSSPAITFTGANGTAPYTFTYNINGGPDQTITTTSGSSATISAPTGAVGVFNYNLTKVADSDPSSCPRNTLGTAIIDIHPLPTITVQPIATQSVCLGGTIAPLSATYVGGTGTVNYQWYSNTTNSNTGGTLIPTATNATYTPPVFGSLGTYYFYVEISFGGDGCGSTISNPAQVNVVSDPVVTTQPLSVQTVCETGTPVDLTVVATGGIGIYTYQWYSNTINSILGGTIISGANNDSYTPPTTNIGTTYYYCEIGQTGLGCGVTSAVARVNVVAGPTIDQQPVSSSVCIGGIADPMTVTYVNGTGTPSYQWFSNTVDNTSTGTAISGATNATFNPPTTVVDSMYYYCEITLTGGGCNKMISNTGKVTVNTLPTVVNNPIPTQTVCLGGVIAPLTATYTGGAGTVSYQWYSNTSNTNSGGTSIPAANSESYTPPAFAATGNYYYYVEISFGGDGCGFTTSNAAEIVVVPDPVISTEPLSSQSICLNSTPANLTVTASGGIGSAYTYQWYRNNLNSNTGGTPILLANGNTFTPSTSTAGTVYYYCVVNQPGLGCDATSATAEVIVTPEPTINNQPLSASVCEGDVPAPLTVTYINGSGTPTYQWYSNIVDDTSTGTLIASGTTASYTPPTTTVGVMYYYCQITLTGGGCSDVTSNTAKVTVNQYPVINDAAISIGSGQTFNIQPSTIVGNLVPVGTTYTWSTPVISPVNAVTGSSIQNTPQTSISQTLTNTTANIATVTYTVTPKMGSCAGNTFDVVVTVYPPINPNIVQTNITCFGDNNGSFQTNITGGNPFTTGSPYVVSWTGPNGFTSSNTTISGLIAGVYTLTITDNGSSPFVKNYTITEPAILTATAIKKDISCYGSANGQISLTVTGGTAPYTYSWLKDGVFYSGNKDLTNLAQGTYAVTITDAHNCTFSQSLIILEPLELQLSSVITNAYDCNDVNSGAINLSVTGGTSPFNYLWSNGAVTQDLVNIPAGNYSVVVTDSRGCTQSELYTVKRNIPILINVNTAKDYDCTTKILKDINTATVTGGVPPYQLVWSSGTVSGANNEIMETTQTGTYTLDVTDALNCTASYSFQLVIDQPGISYTFVDCDKHIIMFNAVIPIGMPSDYTYFWDFGDGTTSTLPNVVHTYPGAGNYTVRLIMDNGTCQSSFVESVFVETPPVLTLDKQPFFCKDDSIVMHVSGADTYRWNNGTTGDSLVVKRPGDYSVTGTSKAGCTSTLSFTMSTFDSFNYTITADKNEVSSDDSQIRLWSESIAYSDYFWDFGDVQTGEGNNIDHNYNITNNVYFDVKLKVINPNGCLEYATKRIWVTSSTLYNTFTPNGDGIDDLFMENKHIQVYNRNGILIYDGSDGWDGTYKGKDVANDTYFFILYYGSVSGLKTNTGFVTVIR